MANTKKKKRVPAKRKKKKKLSKAKIKKTIREIILLAVFIFLVWGSIQLINNPLAVKETDIYIQVGNKFTPKDNIRYAFLGKKNDVKITGMYNTSALGDYVLTYTYKGHKIDVTLHVVDQEGPKLILKNYTTDTIEEVKPQMLVESVSDDSQVSIDFADSKAPSKKAGSQVVEITATDEYGNSTTARTKLKRIQDKSAPEFSGQDQIVEVWQGNESGVGAGISLKDNLDEAPTWKADTSKIDFTTPGTYEVTYTGKDRSGNKTSVKQTVEVKENPEYNKKIVYFTFEGGPTENTERAMEVLNANGIKGTFFINGDNPRFNELVKKAYNEGHTIGLLTNGPMDDYSLYNDSTAYWKNINALNDTVEELTGERSKFIRFLGGSGNTFTADIKPGIMSQLAQEALSNGFQYFDWNVESEDIDYHNMVSADIAEDLSSSEEQIVCIRIGDGPANRSSIDALQQIIDHYKDLGYSFSNITEHTIPIHQEIQN